MISPVLLMRTHWKLLREKRVDKAFNFPLVESMIDTCHHLRNKAINGGQPGIILKLVRNIEKVDFKS